MNYIPPHFPKSRWLMALPFVLATIAVGILAIVMAAMRCAG